MPKWQGDWKQSCAIYLFENACYLHKIRNGLSPPPPMHTHTLCSRLLFRDFLAYLSRIYAPWCFVFIPLDLDTWSLQTREASEPAMPTDLQFLEGTLDDTAMNSAKQLGRQLFSQLDVRERKARLDEMVCTVLFFDDGVLFRTLWVAGSLCTNNRAVQHCWHTIRPQCDVFVVQYPGLAEAYWYTQSPRVYNFMKSKVALMKSHSKIETKPTGKILLGC